MSSSHRTIFAAVVLSAVAIFVWRPWEPAVEAGTSTGDITEPGTGSASDSPRWLPGSPLPALETGAKLALLVGIDDYPGKITDLRGCVADVDRAADLLQQRFGFEPEGIAVLRNQEATHENIVRAFDEWLLQRATPETQVLVWFSGHGSLVPDVDGEGERGNKDNTFLAWDSRQGHDGEYDLVDDEFRSLIAALTDVTPQVTVITDSCHSGTLMRGGSVERPQTRSIPDGDNPADPALVASFWPAGVERVDAAKHELDPSRYVHLAACSPVQLAFEHRYEDRDGERRYQGALSFFLLDELARCEPSVSWGRLSEAVRVKLNRRYHSQVVWSEGALDRRILGGGFEAPIEGYLGHVDGNLVLLEAGRLHRLVPGTKLEIFLLLSDGSEPLGQVIVEQARELDALAEWDGEQPAALADGSVVRAVVTERVPGAQMLYVQAEPYELEDLLPTSVEAVSELEDADILLRRLEGGELAVFDTDGYLIWAEGRDLWGAVQGTDERSPEEMLASVLEVETAYRTLLGLEEEPGRFNIEAHFVEAGQDLLEEYPNAHPAFDPATDSYAALGGADIDRPRVLILQVTNHEKQDLHVAVISLDEMRGRSLIFPSARVGRDNVIAAGKMREFPVGLYIPETWDEGRPMRDRYLIVATREYASFGPLLGSRTRGADEPMPQPLRDALAGPQTRGMGSAKVEKPNWGILAVDVWVNHGPVKD